MKHFFALVGVATICAAVILPFFAVLDHFEAQRQDAMHGVRAAIIDAEWVKVCDSSEAKSADYYDLGGNMAGHL